MVRRVQFSLRTLLEQAAFAAIGFACLRHIGDATGALPNACLVEASAISFGIAYGKLFEMGRAFGLLFGIFAVPIAARFLLYGYKF